MTHAQSIASLIGAKTQQVESAINLLDGGDTVPFIARYRKEVTGGLDDTQLRQLEDRLQYLRDLDDRRESIIKAIEEQGKMTDALKQSLLSADTKTRLEDLYLPYKKKRQTKAQIAREAGIEPLLNQIIDNPGTDKLTLSESSINSEKGFETAEKCLDGARQIAMESISEDADLVQNLRDLMWNQASIKSTLVKDKEKEGQKFKDYFEFSESLKTIPSHRTLALLRGRNEGVLNLKIDIESDNEVHPAIAMMNSHLQWPIEQSSWLKRTVELAWIGKLSVRMSLQLTNLIRENADSEAIRVFAKNLKDILLAAPAGGKSTLGLDPGYRTGVKVVVIDKTGQLTDTAVIYPHAPQKQWDKSKHTLIQLIQKHDIELVSIGNGTASRETDQLVSEILKDHPDIKAQKIMISEAGASVYSASELAAKEFPKLDVSYRGSVSIARRLQDPLAELVKIEPKAIGVGQYQHDVNQVQLNKALSDTVEDCVNSVGVDVNTASAALLKYVAGISDSVAEEIIHHRNEKGRFENRKQLLNVKRLGDKMFQQCAGFLRIRNGDEPLDQSAVHPEAYPLVENMLNSLNCSIQNLIGDSQKLSRLNPTEFANDEFGIETIKDVISELKKPGRDPRGEFKTATFNDSVHEISDLTEGMILEGVVTNVTAFGAFVDIGVHQDGLVHISQLSNSFVKDPADVVKAGQVLKVKVMDFDVARKRISLSARLDDKVSQRTHSKSAKPKKKTASKRADFGSSALANAFAKAKKK
jgi:uncharacterized protein